MEVYNYCNVLVIILFSLNLSSYFHFIFYVLVIDRVIPQASTKLHDHREFKGFKAASDNKVEIFMKHLPMHCGL